MSINWQHIKPYNNSQNNAFEELICQLAREEPIANKKEFYRLAAPDGGVEAYCVLETGEEYGWQAKYFFTMENSQWSQLKKSFETALKTHPKLIKYYICVPLDRQDPRDGKKWFMDKWREKTQKWTESAKSQGREITFEYWGSSELIHRLSEEKHVGRRRFWFATEEFSVNWFQSHIENSIKNLGPRYTPELNFELDIAKHFDVLSRNERFRDFFKNEIHTFLINFNKLDREFLNQDSIKKFIDLLTRQVSISQQSELLSFDLDAINENCRSIEESLTIYWKELRKKENELSKDSLRSKELSIEKAESALNQFKDFIDKSIIALANLPIMLLSGEAGVGKSHLLADIASKRVKENKACILLLGQHFTSKESPWTQILKNLLRLNCNEKEFLGALSARAEAQGERLLFIIDAINEGKGRYFWKEHISSFINDFSKYPWLSLVLTIRTSYEELLTPAKLIPNDVAIRVLHRGFENVEYQAASLFFTHYNIEQHSIPLLHPEFSNPLFLKLFCEGLHRSGYTQIPKGYSGITSIIDFFLHNVDDKLSYPSLFDYNKELKLVKKVINALIQHKLENGLSFVPYEESINIANNIVSRYSNRKDFVDHLISEGVLSKNIQIFSEDEEYIYFAYERFGDHLMTAYLLEKYLDKNNLEIVFQSNGALAQYVEQSYLYQGIVEALSIQLPEQFDKELYELVSDEKKSDSAIAEAFINSLIWRKPETIKEKVKEYVNEHILRNEDTFDLFFRIVYSVSLDPEHFFNANYLHCYLMRLSLADRDAIWTTYLHDKDYQSSAMQRLIDWAWQDGNKSYLSAESRLLAGKALAWLFTSTNISFRDSATKALVCILENNIPTITKFLTEFDSVNDPYVYERIFAAAYGAVLRSDNLEGLADLSNFILKCIFEKEEIYPNVLVRDYARNIIEYALYKQVVTLDNPQIIRPPYKSQFPDSFPSNAEIDTKKSYSFRNLKYWEQDAILSSMVTEYGRGTGHYGDFGRYTFQFALRDWEYQFDPNDLSNYACRLIFEKYGYDVEKHGEFDIHASQGDRHTNKKERIGKKYQWIALYEVLARVADNYKMKDRSTGWGESHKCIWYQGPWEPFIRNIDPTLIYRPKNNALLNHNESWWNKVEYNDWHDNHQNWLINTENLPNPKTIIQLKDTQGNEWLVLETHPVVWNEPVPIGYEQYEYPHKQLSYQIRSYLVREEQAEELIAWAKQQHFMGKWFPESHGRYQIFFREHYWSPAYHFFDNPYYGSSGQWEDVHEKDNHKQVIGKVIVTTESYFWESGADYQEQPSYLVPREFIYEKMQLHDSKNSGEWLNAQGEVVCFNPTVNEEKSGSLIIRKDALLKFLDENNLKIFWTYLGEKQILGNKDPQWSEFSGVFTLNVSSNVDGVIKLYNNSDS